MAKKILLIDDDPDDRDLFCEAIEEIASEIVCSTAPNGQKALAKLNGREIEKPDIIFLDVNMPVMNGWECLMLLQKEEAYKNIPVIMYSTSSHRKDIDNAQQFGALCFFTKPFNFTDLKKNLGIVVAHLNSNSLSSLTLSSPLFLVP